MTATERRAKLSRCRDQVDDVKDVVMALHSGAPAGSRYEIALEEAIALLHKAKAALGSARDAVTA